MKVERESTYRFRGTEKFHEGEDAWAFVMRLVQRVAPEGKIVGVELVTTMIQIGSFGRETIPGDSWWAIRVVETVEAQPDGDGGSNGLHQGINKRDHIPVTRRGLYVLE